MQAASLKSKQSVLATLLALLVLFAGCGDDEPSGPGNFPDIRGTWIGQYSVTSCTLSGGADPFFCVDVFPNGASRVIELDLDQSSSSLSGVAFQGTISGSIAGTVDEFGLVSISGTLGTGDIFEVTITGWTTQLVGDSLVGSWSFRVEDNTGSGFSTAQISANVVIVGPSVLIYFNCFVEDFLAADDEINGTLTAGDCWLDDESFYDTFALDVVQGDKISIDLSSDAYDPFLLITDVDESPLASDGDIGQNVAGVTGEAGQQETWLIIAASFVPYQSGDYRLTTARVTGNSAVTTFTLASRVDGSGKLTAERVSSSRERLKRRLTQARPLVLRR